MKLTIGQRIVLLQTLPKEGDILTLRLLNKLKNELSFSEGEFKECSIVTDPRNGSVSWEIAKDPLKDIEIGEKATQIIRESLLSLDSLKKLHEGHLSLWDIFFDGSEK